ncbi:tyrosine-type recombinase/integrase [Candidatus Margulisiibacteriota bacterium]
MDILSTIKEFLMYLKMEKGSSDLTIIAYRYDYQPFIKFVQRKGLVDLKDITTALLRQYFLEMQQAYQYKINTMCRRINSMRSFFLYCQNQEYIISNPMNKITTPKKEKPLPIYLTDEESKRYIDTPTRDKLGWIRKRDRAILDTFFYTGIRKSELINLDTADINMDEWILKVRKGKGNKDRLIPLNAPLINSLREYLAVKPGKHPALFAAINHSRRLGKNGLYQLFRKHLKNAKINRPEITIHKIRHTFATMILKGSKNLIAVQELLGHVDLSTTRIYLHTTMDDLRRAIEKHPMG